LAGLERRFIIRAIKGRKGNEKIVAEIGT